MFSVCHCFTHTLVFIVGAYSTWAFIPIMFMDWSVSLSDFWNSQAPIAIQSCTELVMCLVINLAFFFMLLFFLNRPSRTFSHFFSLLLSGSFTTGKCFSLSLFSPSVSLFTFVPVLFYVCFI